MLALHDTVRHRKPVTFVPMLALTAHQDYIWVGAISISKARRTAMLLFYCLPSSSQLPSSWRSGEDVSRMAAPTEQAAQHRPGKGTELQKGFSSAGQHQI